MEEINKHKFLTVFVWIYRPLKLFYTCIHPEKNKNYFLFPIPKIVYGTSCILTS